MVFGEIIEPTTRALILDDESEDLPEYQQPVFEWEGDSQPPNEIETLVFVETQKVLQVCSSLTKEKQPLARLKGEGLAIYKLSGKYFVEFNGNNKNLLIGEITEILSPWITKAKTVHGITSAPISSFQNLNSLKGDEPVTFTRCLTNLDDVPYNFCERLETPNLAQGLGATVLTHCIHSDLKGTLWIVYTDNMPLDSVNSSEIVRLLKTLGFEARTETKISSSVSNLYM